MRKKLRLGLSPSMVVAILALIAAISGTAVAGGLLTKKNVNKLITKRAPGLSVGDSAKLGGAPANAYEPRPQWAFVNRFGTVLAQSGGISVNATNASVGQFFLDFGKSVANRPVSVVLHYGDGGGLTGDVSATPCGGSAVPGGFDCTSLTGVNDANHLLVRTQSSTGSDAAFGFYVRVGT
jgi:hypothetical protein